MKLTLGIDSSTQGVKVVARDVAAQKIAFSAAVNYGRDLPQYGSPDGFLPNDDVLVRHADPRMWVEGLELVLKRLQESGCPMADIVAIGGDAQQHATVFLSEHGVEKLRGGDVESSWFSRSISPIWMDSSTGAEVAALDAKFGSRLQADTGSPAIERFAGPQIMKFAKEDPEGYAKTKRIHLLSSFLASYLAGEDMPIDTGDGAGMNLLNLKTGGWDAEICEFAAPGLLAKLPQIEQSNNSNGRTIKPLCSRFAKFGLRPGIPVVPFTGDNPASLVGCFAERPGTAVISLGTSDVFFAAMDSFRTDPDGYGHVFGNPMGGFMSLSCFKNGSLARDRVRRELGVDWAFFDETAWQSNNQTIKQTNNPPRAYPYFEAEITPKHPATGIEANFDWNAADAATKVRAVVEGQVANMYERTRWIGDFEEIRVTGGASRSKGICAAIARVFKAKVTTPDVADSAAVGGARLAGTVACAVGLMLSLHAAETLTVDPNNNFGTDQYEEFAAHPSPDVPPPPADALYRNPKAPLEDRVNDVFRYLTPEEQATLLHAGGSLNMLAIPRIGLGDYRFTDGASGIRAEKQPGVTYMPNGIAWAATFDKDLARENGRVQGEEVRAAYGHGPRFNGVCRMMLGPGANIARTPLGARNFEYLGEDPVLVGHIAGAFCQGLQQSRVSPTVKHYALNNQECMRTVIMVHCGDRALREIYTRSFGIACAQYGAWAVMNAYNAYNGDWASHSWPLNSILLKDYAWDGAVVSDWGGYHNDVCAINGGTSMETPGKYDAARNAAELKNLRDGTIDPAKWEDGVKRVLRLSFRVGAFDARSDEEKTLQLRCEKAFRSEDHRRVSYACAAESFVLLKNDGFLPLDVKRIRTVAVVGPNADQYHTMMDGHGIRERGGSGAVKAAREITPLEGICARFGRENVRFAPCYRLEGDQGRETAVSVEGMKALTLESAVKGADLVVFCAGLDHAYDREVLGWNFPTPSDRPDLHFKTMPGFPRQEDLIRRCAALNPNTVVAITAGAPVTTAEWVDSARAVVMCWYGGEFHGQVLADMLSGDVNPSGRLPYTFGRRIEDWPCHRMGERVYPGVRLPEPRELQGSKLKAEQWYDDGIWVGYRGFEHFGTTPEYPFGFGLSYTTFAVSDLRLEGDSGASAEVVNTGGRKGRCVVQCYVSKPAQPDAEMPVKELADFASIELGPGQGGRVRFAFDGLTFKYWSEREKGWRTAAGRNVIRVGFSSADLPLQAEIVK